MSLPLSIEDPVHGTILIPAAVKLVLNSPEVQRLRDLHQLGLASYVYPSATHTRFEHSVGCMHLALTLLDTVVQNHRNFGISLPFEGFRATTATENHRNDNTGGVVERTALEPGRELRAVPSPSADIVQHESHAPALPPASRSLSAEHGGGTTADVAGEEVSAYRKRRRTAEPLQGNTASLPSDVLSPTAAETPSNAAPLSKKKGRPQVASLRALTPQHSVSHTSTAPLYSTPSSQPQPPHVSVRLFDSPLTTHSSTDAAVSDRASQPPSSQPELAAQGQTSGKGVDSNVMHRGGGGGDSEGIDEDEDEDEEALDEASEQYDDFDEDLDNPFEVTARDRVCVAIAGLCHDVGHGPLSHSFESLVNESWGGAAKRRKKWEHEDMSMRLLDKIWHDVGSALREQFGLTRKDKEFVKLMMKGLKASDPFPQARVGRPAWKRFMVDIVANKVHGLDVDKLDYLQRDGFFVGQRRELYVKRIFQNAFVVPVRPTDKWGAGAHPDTPEGTQYRICYSEKVLENIATIFDMRFLLHRIVYQHRVVRLMTRMAKDALALCSRAQIIPCGEKRYTLREAADDVHAFLHTSEWILGYIKTMDCNNVPIEPPPESIFAIRSKQNHNRRKKQPSPPPQQQQQDVGIIPGLISPTRPPLPAHPSADLLLESPLQPLTERLPSDGGVHHPHRSHTHPLPPSENVVSREGSLFQLVQDVPPGFPLVHTPRHTQGGGGGSTTHEEGSIALPHTPHPLYTLSTSPMRGTTTAGGRTGVSSLPNSQNNSQLEPPSTPNNPQDEPVPQRPSHPHEGGEACYGPQEGVLFEASVPTSGMHGQLVSASSAAELVAEVEAARAAEEEAERRAALLQAYEAKERERLRRAQAILRRMDSRDMYLDVLFKNRSELEEQQPPPPLSSATTTETTIAGEGAKPHVAKKANHPKPQNYMERVAEEALVLLEKERKDLYRKVKQWEASNEGLSAFCYEKRVFSLAPKEVEAEHGFTHPADLVTVVDPRRMVKAERLHRLEREMYRVEAKIRLLEQRLSSTSPPVTKKPKSTTPSSTSSAAGTLPSVVTLRGRVVTLPEMQLRQLRRYRCRLRALQETQQMEHVAQRGAGGVDNDHEVHLLHQNENEEDVGCAGALLSKPQQRSVLDEESVIPSKSSHLNNTASSRGDVHFTFLYWMCRLNRPPAASATTTTMVSPERRTNPTHLTNSATAGGKGGKGGRGSATLNAPGSLTLTEDEVRALKIYFNTALQKQQLE